MSSLFLLSCSNSSNRENTNRLTMKEVHQKHQRNLYGQDIDKARESWSAPSIDKGYLGVNFSDDLRLPNPELVMTVFPERNSAGAVRPGYKMKFSMYEKVHYKIGY
jgi:hypothetical protein